MKNANPAPAYACCYAEFAELARSMGYALAIHGSLARDLDLICIPWIEAPHHPSEVVAAFTSKFALRHIHQPELKLHNRLVYTLTFGWGDCFMDFSFMPALTYAPLDLELD